MASRSSRIFSPHHGESSGSNILEESTHSPGFNTPPRAVSPTSSQGSWVFDPEDGGWDGLGASPAQVGQIGQQERLVQREASSAESLLHSWAGVPRSPPVAEYPTNSPPCSPISTRSRGSSGAAGEGLVGLAREEISDQMETLEGHAVYFSRPPSTMEPRDHVAWASGVAISSAGEFTEVEDVDMVDDAISNSTQEPVAIVTGMTKAETIEAIAEAAEIETATLPRPVSPQLPAGPLPPLRWASPLEEEATMVDSRPDEVPGTASPLRVHPSPSSTIDVAADAGPTAVRVAEPSLPPPTCVPMEGSIDVDGIGMSGVGVNDNDDGKQLDRLLRWTGLITAAKMGVIPIIVCATVAALSTQGSSGGNDRGGRSGGGGGGGGAGGGGGGGPRCSSRKPRPRGGGGGGTGCFPGIRSDHSVYGCMPMPYCVAPSVACT